MTATNTAPKNASPADADAGGGAKAAPTKTAKPAIAKVAAARKPAKVARAPKPARAAVPKREKLVRDSFTIPKTEYEALGQLKLRAAGLATPVKKSELLRAGIMTLVAMNDARFRAALKRVPALKTGRPTADLSTNAAPEGRGAKAARARAQGK